MKKYKQFILFNSIALSFSEGAEYELISTAKQFDQRYGEFQFSQEDLQQMADNFNEDIVGTEIPVDKNHDPDHIALAWIEAGSMTVKPSTKLSGEFSLYARLDKHTPTGKELMETGALRYFSLQIQGKMEKVIDGVKRTFKNVIRSLALTNQPVIKDLQPTFSEKINHLSNNNHTMDLVQFLALADNFLNEEKITKAQFTTLKTLAEGLPEEDKPAAEEKVAEAEEKVDAEEKELGGDKKKKELTEDEKKALKEKEAAEKTEKELAEKLGDKKSFSLAEVMDVVKAALNPVSKKLNEVITDQRDKSLAASVDSLCLSDTQQVGIKSDAKDGVLAFVKTLSDVQAAAYFELHKGIITSVDLNEYGHSPTEKGGNALEKIKTLSEKMAKEDKIDLSEARKIVMSNNPKLAKEASELKKY